MALAEDLKQIVKGEVMSDDTSLDRYSRDASLFTVKPAVAVAPADVEDIKALVRYAQEHEGVSLTGRAAGTDMSGGPLTESIVLDFTKHFNQIREVGDNYAVTQPGVYYRDFEKATLAKGLLMPSYPASREICAIGGMVANNSGGEKTLTYGQTKDYVMELKAVLADGNEYTITTLDEAGLQAKIAQGGFEGELYRQINDLVRTNHDLLMEHKPHVHKNSAGYFLWDVWDGTMFNMQKLLTGSQGTLGLITEVKLRLIKPKAHTKLMVVFLHKLDRLGDIATTILQYQPEAFESYDDKTLMIALRFLPNFVKLLGTNLLKLAWQFLPEVGMFLRGGLRFPKLILMAEFTGDSEEEVDKKISGALAAMKPFHVPVRVTKNELEVQKYWTIRRESFNLLRNHVPGQRTAPFIDDFVVLPKYLPEFLPKLEAIMKPYNLVYSVAGHVGDGNFHIIPLMKLGDERIKTIIPELSKKVYDLILQFHGSITGEHNDGMIRTPFLKQMYGEQMYALFEQTKKIFDPKNIFNLGKKVGGNFDYAMAHLQTAKK